MKILSIFKKNIKMVSRTGSYFFILFLCPIALIFIASVMLNSSDFKNIQVGIIDKEGVGIDLGGINNVVVYDDLSSCLYLLTSTDMSACIHARKIDSVPTVEIYLDNSMRVVEYYLRQYILETVLTRQNFIIDKTSEALGEKIITYTAYIEDAKTELTNASAELEEQERVLNEYKTNLTILRTEFDSVYYPLNDSKTSIRQLKADMENDNQNLNSDIASFRQNKQNTVTQINVLKTFLSTRLNADDYNYAASVLDSTVQDLNEIDADLTEIQDSQNQLITAVNRLELAMQKIDEIKALLDKLDSDLTTAIQRTHENKIRVDNFISRLDDVKTEVSQFSDYPDKGVVTKFQKILPERSDPVFFSFPLIVAIIVTFTSLILSNLFVIKQINTSSYFRDVLTPTRDSTFIFSDYLINLFFVFIQVSILFFIASYWFEVPVETGYVFYLVCLLSASFFILIGMSFGYLVKSESTSMLITIFFLMIILILSDLFTPAVLTAPLIRFLVSLNPFMTISTILADVLIFSKTLEQITPALTKLGFFVFTGIILAYISKKISKTKLMQN